MSKESDFIDILHKEMEDLKNGLQTDYSRHLEQENAQLKQQLADKDKEIEQLKEKCNKLSDEEFEHFGDMKTYKNMWLKEQKQSIKLRHEICDKIRKQEIRHRYDGDTNSVIDGYFVDKEILDQIENGEE